MLNTNDIEHVVGLLADDFRYCSQAVLTDLVGKEEFLTYKRRKLAATAGRADRPVAEMAYLPAMRNRACLVLFDNNTGQSLCTVLAMVKDARLSQIDLCLVPPPTTAVRTGEVPR